MGVKSVMVNLSYHEVNVTLDNRPELVLHVQPELQGEDDSVAQAVFPVRSSAPPHPPHVPAPPQQQVQVAADILRPGVLLDPENMKGFDVI